MGYKVTRKTYRLVFQDPECAGLEVTTHGLSTGQYLDLMSARAQTASGGAEGRAAMERVLGMLADSLVSWNAEDEDGQPIPTTLDGIKSQDLEFNTRLVDAWGDAVGGVSAPLPQTSSGGSPSVEASIPMDDPSASLAS